MFFYESISWQTALMWFAVFGGLMLLNEISRRNKWAGLALFLGVPILLTLFVWPTTTTAEGSSVNDWFHWAKVYSALAGCMGFWLLRHVKKLSKNKILLAFPALILAINICEAVIRDFQIYSLGFSTPTLFEGMMLVSGPWNIMNGIAGILNIITISGTLGIVIGKDKCKDMLWPDQLWFWIIAYDLWNFAYTYNCIPDHSFYAGLALLLSCTVPAFFIKKGAWLQHRAATLAFWCMFAMTWPAFIDNSQFAVKSSHNETALMIVSVAALLANIAVFVYHFYRVFKFKRNPLTQEIYPELKAYQEVRVMGE